MNDYAACFIKRWKDGSFPPSLEKEGGWGEPTTIMVTWYDQTNRAYEVPDSWLDGFGEWVVANWGPGDACPSEGESDSDYLDRAGISVREHY